MHMIVNCILAHETNSSKTSTSFNATHSENDDEREKLAINLTSTDDCIFNLSEREQDVKYIVAMDGGGY